MLLNEFTERTGLNPTQEEFDDIHYMYMCTEMSKDEFCEDFKKCVGSKILNCLCKEARTSTKLYRDVNAKGKLLSKELLAYSAKYNIPELEKEAQRFLSRKEIILENISRNISLSATDLEYISNHLQ